MGRAVLQGISTALLVTVLTLVAGILWSSTGLGVVSVSQLVDIGLLASCLIGGYRTGKETSHWYFGTLVGAGFVTIGSLLLALFTPVRGIGFLQVLLIGALLGSVAGAFGTGSINRQVSHSSGTRRVPAYSTWSESDDWQTIGEDQWTKVADEPAQVPNTPIIYEHKINSNSEDGGYEGAYLSLDSFKESASKGDEEKKYVGQSSSPWWEKELENNSQCIIHNA
ncbi:MAG: hypothetical protein ACYDEJ_07690 [Desulfitobacteriaceae bacterium]